MTKLSISKGKDIIMNRGTLSQVGVQGTPWWMLLLEGIAALVIGLFLITSPGMTVLVLTQFVGFFWLFTGILSLVNLFMDSSQWGWKLAGGILGILAGLAVIRNPLWSAVLLPTLLVIMLGIQGLIQGVVKFVQAFRGGGLGSAVLGLLHFAFGIILLSSPLVSALVLVLLIGIFAIVGGISTIVLAFRQRNMEPAHQQPVPSM